jgi:apolipoprotein N-acyltransferase
MLSILRSLHAYYSRKNRWWLPLVLGLFYSICFAPFDQTTTPFFSFLPLGSFFVLIPVFAFSTRRNCRRGLFHAYLFGVAASLSQYYWLSNVLAEGLWHLIIMGLILLCLYLGLYFLLAGWVFRIMSKALPRLTFLLFPAFWVVIEYQKSLGELSFPWNFLGYALTPVLQISQLASITGVFGLSFLIVAGNVLMWQWMQQSFSTGRIRNRRLRPIIVLGVILVVVSLWGFVRLQAPLPDAKLTRISLIQAHIDQNHWGNQSLDTSFAIDEILTREAGLQHPDLLVYPESALLCYLDKRTALKYRVISWRDSLKIPFLVGALDWQMPPKNSIYDYYVYNTAFFLDNHSRELQPYYKIKLVPFSEILPFEGFLPILSRVNLGEADFKKGTRESIFNVIPGVRAAPFICYEIIYPDFVRRRVANGANVLVNITNDGWFGKSTAPFQHATMARMRCIENGVSLARCANSGISMFVDPHGKLLSRTKLYTRTVLTEQLPVAKVNTFYTKAGDWPVWLSMVILVLGIGWRVAGESIRDLKKRKCNS